MPKPTFLPSRFLPLFLQTVLAFSGLSLLLSPTQPTSTLLGFFFLLLLSLWHPRFTFSLALLSSLGGVFLSLSFLSQNLPLLDLLTGLTVLGGILLLLTRHLHTPLPPILKPLLLFFFFAILSLLLALPSLPVSALTSSLLYLLRFLTYLLLIPLTPFILTPHPHSRPIRFLTLLLTLLTLGLLITGFYQFLFYNNFINLGLADQGWDPHIGRLTSTWLDPNYLGGAFAVLLAFFTARLVCLPRYRLPTLALILLLLLALFLTYSRSAYLAAATALSLIALIRARWLFLAGVLSLLLLISFSPRAQDRLTDLSDSALAFTGLTDTTVLDPTARLRVESWLSALDLIKTHPFFGVGFGNYAHAQWSAGRLHNLSAHYASGSDASLLNIWATTGTFGLLAFLFFLFSIFSRIIHNLYSAPPSSPHFALALGSGAGLLGLLVHSFFVNSLFFPLILILLLPLLGLLYLNPKK